MKTTVVALVCLLASASAFTPPTFATRAVGTRAVKKVKKPVATKAIKKVVKKPVAKKPVATKAVKKVVKKPVAKAKSTGSSGLQFKNTLKKKGPPESKGYPSFRAAAENFSLGNISGGGNKAPPTYYTVPDFSDPKKQIKRDPKVYAEAAKTRLSKNQVFAYDDGLTELERKQRGGAMATFLTGSAKSQVDPSAIRDDIEGDSLIFGLDPDRFQLLFITIFGLFTLVGCLSGTIDL